MVISKKLLTCRIPTYWRPEIIYDNLKGKDFSSRKLLKSKDNDVFIAFPKSGPNERIPLFK